jgi:hypothetical protein
MYAALSLSREREISAPRSRTESTTQDEGGAPPPTHTRLMYDVHSRSLSTLLCPLRELSERREALSAL